MEEVLVAQWCGQCDLKGHEYTPYYKHINQGQEKFVYTTNLPRGKRWLLTVGRTNSPLWPIQKPTQRGTKIKMVVVNLWMSMRCVTFISFFFFYFVFTLISRYLAHHAGSAPDVSGCAIVSTNQDLHRTILTRLDVFGKVFVLATR